MSDKEALRWKQTFLRSITDQDGEMDFPTLKEFTQELMNYFQPANTTQDAAHQLTMLRQGKKTAEEIITEFRLLTSLAGYSADTPSDHMHLIEKLRRVLNPTLVRRIMLSDNAPTTLNGWVQKAILIDSQYRMTMEIMNEQKNEGKPRNDKQSNKTDWSGYYKPKKAKEERDPDAMDVDAMSTEKRTALMKKGACFICEELGHIAREHKEYEKKKKEKRTNIRRTTMTPSTSSKKKEIKEIFALLQGLSQEETKELLALKSSGQEDEKKEENEKDDSDDEDF